MTCAQSFYPESALPGALSQNFQHAQEYFNFPGPPKYHFTRGKPAALRAFRVITANVGSVTYVTLRAAALQHSWPTDRPGPIRLQF